MRRFLLGSLAALGLALVLCPSGMARGCRGGCCGGGGMAFAPMGGCASCGMGGMGCASCGMGVSGGGFMGCASCPAGCPCGLAACPSCVACPAQSNQARIVVHLPAEARVSIDGEQTASTGPERTYNTPPLTAGVTYYYTVQIDVAHGGKPVSVKKRIAVRANEITQLEVLLAQR